MKYYFLCYCLTKSLPAGVATSFLNIVTTLDPVNISNYFYTKNTPKQLRAVVQWQEITKDQYNNFFDARRIEKLQQLN